MTRNIRRWRRPEEGHSKRPGWQVHDRTVVGQLDDCRRGGERRCWKRNSELTTLCTLHPQVSRCTQNASSQELRTGWKLRHEDAAERRRSVRSRQHMEKYRLA